MIQLSSRGRVVAIAVPATLLAILLAFRRAPAHVETAKEVPAATAATAPAGEPIRTQIADQPAEPAPPAEPPPIIDSVRIDKSRVCEGEVAIVTVEAHSQTGDDGALRTLVGPTPGKTVPVRLWLDENGASTMPDVRVFGGKGGSASRPVPHVQVDRCPGQLFAFVEALPVRNAPEQRELHVVVRGGGDGGVPEVRSVRWTFGDGTEVSAGTATTHEFVLGSDVHPSFLVTAVAQLGDGKTVKGAASVELLDRAAYERRQGGALLVVRALDRFPVAAASGGFSQRFRIMNREDEAITVDDVEIETRLHGESEPILTHASPSTVLPRAMLGAHSEVTVTMHVDPEQPAGLDFRTYGLVGKTSSGRPAHGSLTAMAPLGKPSVENTTPISPALEARVLRARKILKKDIVSAADVRDLERQGRFKDLAQLSDDVPEPALPF